MAEDIQYSSNPYLDILFAKHILKINSQINPKTGEPPRVEMDDGEYRIGLKIYNPAEMKKAGLDPNDEYAGLGRSILEEEIIKSMQVDLNEKIHLLENKDEAYKRQHESNAVKGYPTRDEIANQNQLSALNEVSDELDIFIQARDKINKGEENSLTPAEMSLQKNVGAFQATIQETYDQAKAESGRINKPVPVPPKGANGEEPEDVNPPRIQPKDSAPAAGENPPIDPNKPAVSLSPVFIEVEIENGKVKSAKLNGPIQSLTEEQLENLLRLQEETMRESPKAWEPLEENKPNVPKDGANAQIDGHSNIQVVKFEDVPKLLLLKDFPVIPRENRVGHGAAPKTAPLQLDIPKGGVDILRLDAPLREAPDEDLGDLKPMPTAPKAKPLNPSAPNKPNQPSGRVH